MRKKPDILIILAAIFSIGALISNYTFGNIEPEQVASQIIIR